MIEIGNFSKNNGTPSAGPPGMRMGYQDYARLIDVICIATMLRNFPMTSLRGEESRGVLQTPEILHRPGSQML